MGEKKKTYNTFLYEAVGSHLGGIGAATVKVAVAATTAPDPGPWRTYGFSQLLTGGPRREAVRVGTHKAGTVVPGQRRKMVEIKGGCSISKQICGGNETPF